MLSLLVDMLWEVPLQLPLWLWLWLSLWVFTTSATGKGPVDLLYNPAEGCCRRLCGEGGGVVAEEATSTGLGAEGRGLMNTSLVWRPEDRVMVKGRGAMSGEVG